MPSTPNTGLSIADLLSGDLQLSTPPNIYFELQKVTEQSSQSLDAAAFIIEKDPALTMQLLKIVNSAFYGFPSKIINIKRAIAMIGTSELQTLVLAAVVIDKFSNLPGGIISMHDFWTRSLSCALIAKEFGVYLKYQDYDAYFICGLLHNIGQLVLLRRIPELVRNIALSQREFTDAEEISLEKAMIGFDHFQTGAALSELWNLPIIITESIRLHSQPDHNSPFHAFAGLIRTANEYSRVKFNPCSSIENNLGLPAESVQLALEKSQNQFAAIFNIFYPG